MLIRLFALDFESERSECSVVLLYGRAVRRDAVLSRLLSSEEHTHPCTVYANLDDATLRWPRHLCSPPCDDKPNIIVS